MLAFMLVVHVQLSVRSKGVGSTWRPGRSGPCLGRACTSTQTRHDQKSLTTGLNLAVAPGHVSSSARVSFRVVSLPNSGMAPLLSATLVPGELAPPHSSTKLAEEMRPIVEQSRSR